MRLLMTLGILYFLLACSNENHAGGGNTAETGNSISSLVLLPNGKPAVGTQIIVRSSWPLDSTIVLNANGLMDSILATSTTDSLGHFQVIIPKNIPWMLEATDANSHFKASTNQNQSVIQLDSTMQLNGRAYLHATDSFLVKILGFNRIAVCDSSGFFQFDSLPKGAKNIVVISIDGDRTNIKNMALDNNNTHSEIDLGIIPIQELNHRKFVLKIPAGTIDTTLIGYPLLVRIPQELYDSILLDSLPLRVTRGSTLLSYDLDHNQSLILDSILWVRVDRIPPSNQDDSIVFDLWWGAPIWDEPIIPQVFSLQDGWLSVLHLTDSIAHHGPPLDAMPSPVQAVIGNGAIFNGLANGEQSVRTLIDSLSTPQDLFVSGWIRASQFDNTEVPWCGSLQGQLWSLQGTVDGYWSFRTEIQTAIQPQWSNLLATDSWYYIATWIQSSTATTAISINGWAPITANTDGILNKSTSLQIGCSFHGQMDEVRVRTTVPPISQLRLDHWVQSPNSNAIHW